eukprot:419251-Pyramimonas_sp.AAC.1
MAEGFHVAFPGQEVQRPAGTGDPNSAQRLTDAFALDSRIRWAIQSSDLLERWTEGLGSEVRREVRRRCGDIRLAVEFVDSFDGVPPMAKTRLAIGRYGHFVTGAAIGIIRHIPNKIEEVGLAEPPAAAPSD